MTYKISPDRRKLTIFVSEAEREELRNIQECGGDCQCDVSMYDFLEPLIANSELDWINPCETGDLTDAPMLGFLTAPEFKRHNIKTVENLRNRIVSCSTEGLMVCHVFERWAYMNYMIRSPLEDLRDQGFAEFVNGE